MKGSLCANSRGGEKLHTIVCQPDVNSWVWLVVEGWRQLPHQNILTLKVSVDYVLAVQVL